jgi:hypothetical protein
MDDKAIKEFLKHPVVIVFKASKIVLRQILYRQRKRNHLKINLIYILERCFLEN